MIEKNMLPLNEAKLQVGSTKLVITKSYLGEKNANRGRDGSYKAEVDDKLDVQEDGLCIVKITGAGSTWAYGKVLYYNCSKRDIRGSRETILKFPVKECRDTGIEFQVITKNEAEIKNTIGKQFFMENSKDAKFTDIEGNQIDLPDEGNYTVTGLNFHLTKLKGIPIYTLKKHDELVYSTIKNLEDTSTKEMDSSQQKALAKRISTKLGIDIRTSENYRDTIDFTIHGFQIIGDTFSGDYGSGTGVGVFLKKEDAEKALDFLKTIKSPSFYASYKIESFKSRTMDYEDLMKFSKHNKIEMDTKKEIKNSRGAILTDRLGM